MDILLDMSPREQTCCFTGHRRIAASAHDDLIAAVDVSIKKLYNDGYRYFITGGALGFDTLAAVEVLRAARFDRSIKLILALPCRDQTARWDLADNFPKQLQLYHRLLGLADRVVYINDFYTDTCMKERNQYMIDRSSACIAYYSGSPRSGAGQTYRMAIAGGLDVYNVYKKA